MRSIHSFIIAVFSFVTILNAQSDKTEITGKVTDLKTSTPLISASVTLTSIRDSSNLFALTDRKGEFKIENASFGRYKLKITYIGYNDLEKEVRVTPREGGNLGKLELDPADVKLSEVTIEGDAPIGEVKEDTIEYKSSAFKTQPDAVAEDLIKKMPGVTVENDGTVKAQGEDVKKVMVDGKPFFGSDPTLALRNIPAEVIDRIQVYDRMSDFSDFTGFDDGNTERTMNIITRSNRSMGEFGKLQLGGGENSRYSLSANLNLFNKDRRISLLGMSNNINQQNFAIEDLMGVFNANDQRSQMFRTMGRRMGPPMRGRAPGQGGPTGASGISNFMVGQLEGISTTHAAGVNYSEAWASNIDFSGSYFFNITSNDNRQNVLRDYFITADTIQNYLQDGTTNTDNYNHRVNFQIRYDIDSSSTLFIKPSLNFQGNDYLNSYETNNSLFGNMLNESDNRYNSNSSGYNISANLIYRLKLDTSGRTLSFNINAGANDKKAEANQLAVTDYYNQSGVTADSLDVFYNQPASGDNLSFNTSYVNPLGDKGQLMLSYNYSIRNNQSDKASFRPDSLTDLYTIQDSSLSNKYDNSYNTHQAGLNYRFRDGDFNLTATLNYQRAILEGDQFFPSRFYRKYEFDNVLPSLQINYKFSLFSNIRINFRTSTNAPSITQLQDVIDYSNPLQISTGNPDLKHQYTYFAMSRYMNLHFNMRNVFMIFAMFSNTSDYIGNAYTLATRDTVIENNISLPAGAQFTKPVNLGNSQTIRSFLTYGFPLDFISSNINFNIGGSYLSSPNLLNGIENRSNTTNVNAMMVLSSNIDSTLDFNISIGANINNTVNTINKSLDNNYNNYNINFDFKWIVWNGFYLQTNLRSQYYDAFVNSADIKYSILNLAIGKKFLANDRAELKLSAFDVLGENKSIQTNATDFYSEYSTNDVLKSYIMLSFAYNLSNF